MIGYHASHEQFKPSLLLDLVQMAEKAGFTSVNSSDHFHPWSERQGESGHSFSWLGAAMAITSIPFSVVCAPGQRYHPAIVAQASATLEEMFPGRFSIALASGEALNERITGEKWPEKDERNKRLVECWDVIKALFNGENLTHYGRVVVEHAKLYTRPEKPPLMIGAAVTQKTAEWMGSWADGLITVHRPFDELKKVIEGFRKNGGKGKPVFLKVQLSYASEKSAAMEGAYDQWRTNIFNGSVLADLWKVSHYDALGEFVQHSQLEEMVRISSDTQQHIDWIKKDMELDFDRIILHNVSRNQEEFINVFGDKVLPSLK
jgi:coenzyme F420-dependent glucose-6-phosphate dehydrogenase